MPKTMYVKPAEGLIVRDPVTGNPLPADGDHVPRISYWLRRQADGDVITAKPVNPPKKEK